MNTSDENGNNANSGSNANSGNGNGNVNGKEPTGSIIKMNPMCLGISLWIPALFVFLAYRIAVSQNLKIKYWPGLWWILFAALVMASQVAVCSIDALSNEVSITSAVGLGVVLPLVMWFVWFLARR